MKFTDSDFNKYLNPILFKEFLPPFKVSHVKKAWESLQLKLLNALIGVFSNNLVIPVEIRRKYLDFWQTITYLEYFYK